MSDCWKCGSEIVWVQRWTGGFVACDPEPDETARESFVEVAPEAFVSVFLHDCQPREEKPKHKPINWVYKGRKKWASSRASTPASPVENRKQLELFTAIPKK